MVEMIKTNNIQLRKGGVLSPILSNRVYTRRAERDIKKLEPNTKDRIGTGARDEKTK
jgi:hypothetical protein